MLQSSADSAFRKYRIITEPVLIFFAMAYISASLKGAFLVISVILVFLWGVSLICGLYLSIFDANKVRHLAAVSENPTAEGVQSAFQDCKSSEPAIRRFATAALASMCDGTPGKLVKAVDAPPETIINTLAGNLESEDPLTVGNTAICLRWLSRDYTEPCIPHAGSIAKTLGTHQDTRVRRNLLFALGWIGMHDTPRDGAYAEAIVPGVKDPDAEVRSAAAVALQAIPRSEKSEELLNMLARDSAPAVQEALE